MVFRKNYSREFKIEAVKLVTEAEALRKLQRENERLRMERDILKKAVAIFSKKPKTSTGL